MKRIRTFLGVTGLAMLGVVGPTVVACSKDSVPPSSQNPIKIGVSYAKTGSYSGIGIGLLQGVQSAAYLINARGGVLGRPIQLLPVDDQSSNENGSDKGAHLQQVIKGFVDQKVAAIIGPGATVQVRDAMAVAYPEGEQKDVTSGVSNTLVISAWATSPVLTTTWNPWPNRFFYRTPPSDYYQRVALYKRMTDTTPPPGSDAGSVPPPCSQPFLVYATDALGTTYYDFFQKKGLQDNAIGVGTGIDSNGYQSVVEAINKRRPDCVAFVTYQDVTASVINTLASAGVLHGLKLFASDASFDPGLFTTINDPTYLNGLAGVEPDTTPPTRNFQDFQDIFQAQTTPVNGKLVPPPNYAANAFDALVLVAFAIERAGTDTDSNKIRDALVEVSRGFPGNATARSTTNPPQVVTPATIDVGFSTIHAGGLINYEGASGSVDFDQNGDVAAGYVKWDVKLDTNGQPYFFVESGDGSRYAPDVLTPAEPD